MMKDYFPFSQLGHALTHHYPIDLIHGLPSASPYLPRSYPSASHSLPLPYLHLLLPVDPCMLSHILPLLYLPQCSFSFPFLNPLSSSLCPYVLSVLCHFFFPPRFSLLMHSIHLHIECLFFYIILLFCHSPPPLSSFSPLQYLQSIPSPSSFCKDN